MAGDDASQLLRESVPAELAVVHESESVSQSVPRLELQGGAFARQLPLSARTGGDICTESDSGLRARGAVLSDAKNSAVDTNLLLT